MNEATLPTFRCTRGIPWLLGGFAVSVCAHVALLLYLDGRPARVAEFNKVIELELVQVEPPKLPPPKEEPKEEKKETVKPPPVKVAVVKPPPPPNEQAPPRPNDTPTSETPPKPVALVVGISMSSTTAAGGFAAPVGNTVYGKAADKATAPEDVHAYVAPKYTPIYQVDSEPQVDSEVKIPYPEEARRAGIEGSVILSVVIDTSGKVVRVKVISGPGYGLNEAARDALPHFHFKPAVKAGEAVSTEMKYTYTFLLD